jgi:hypothetical protein
MNRNGYWIRRKKRVCVFCSDFFFSFDEKNNKNNNFVSTRKKNPSSSSQIVSRKIYLQCAPKKKKTIFLFVDRKMSVVTNPSSLITTIALFLTSTLLSGAAALIPWQLVAPAGGRYFGFQLFIAVPASGVLAAMISGHFFPGSWLFGCLLFPVLNMSVNGFYIKAMIGLMKSREKSRGAPTPHMPRTPRQGVLVRN